MANAGEQLNRIGDHDAALEVFRHAVGAEGHVPPDVRCYLHHELLAVGDVAGARRLADELRRERPADGDVYLFVGESYELVGDLREAHRWMTAAHAGPGRAGEDLAVGDAAGLVRTRYRVHRALDLPMDEYDERVDRRRSAD